MGVECGRAWLNVVRSRLVIETINHNRRTAWCMILAKVQRKIDGGGGGIDQRQHPEKRRKWSKVKRDYECYISIPRLLIRRELGNSLAKSRHAPQQCLFSVEGIK